MTKTCITSCVMQKNYEWWEGRVEIVLDRGRRRVHSDVVCREPVFLLHFIKEKSSCTVRHVNFFWPLSRKDRVQAYPSLISEGRALISEILLARCSPHFCPAAGDLSPTEGGKVPSLLITLQTNPSPKSHRVGRCFDWRFFAPREGRKRLLGWSSCFSDTSSTL